MPLYHYQAIDGAGNLVEGELEAANQAAVLTLVAGFGHCPLKALPAERSGFTRAGIATRFSLSRGFNRATVLNLVRDLGVMLGAGLPLDQALRFLVENADNKTHATRLTRIRDAVRGGKSLAAALSVERGIPKLVAGLVEAGEAGATLAETLTHLATHLEAEYKLRQTIRSAMIYPTLLLIVALASIVQLLVFVLPQFTPIFVEAGAKLPPLTALMIGFGNLIRDDGWLMVTAALLLFLSVHYALRFATIRLSLDRFLLRLPIFGSLIRATEAARFSRTLGTLLENGVGMIAALSLCAKAITNRIIINALGAAQRDTREGKSLAAALQHADIFPRRTVHLIRLGEETGRLGAMALRAAALQEDEVHTRTERLVALLTPMIIIVMGGLVAAIISSLMMAMLSLNDLAL